MGWIIAGVCVAGFAVSNRIIATRHPRGSFERIALNCLVAGVWLCFAAAAGLVVSAT